MVKPLSPELKKILEDAIPKRNEAAAKKALGVEHWFADESWPDRSSRLVSQPTINIEGLVGGYTGPGGKTILPHRAVAKIDMRLVPDMTAKGTLELLKAHLAKHGFGDIEVNMTGGYDPTETSADSKLVKAMAATYRKAGIEPLLWPRLAGSWPGVTFTGAPLEPAGGAVRPRTRQRCTRARRVLGHRGVKPEGGRDGRRRAVVRRPVLRARAVSAPEAWGPPRRQAAPRHSRPVFVESIPMQTRHPGIFVPMALLAAVLGAAPTSAIAAGQGAQPPGAAIVPRPVSMTPGTGVFTLTPRTVIWTDRASESLGRRLAGWLEPATGIAIPVRVGRSTSAGRIVLTRDPTLARLGAEGYRAEVSASGVLVSAPDAAGLFYGLQTIRQLLPPQIFREAKVEGVAWTMPAVTIEDRPRFGWRGAHLDVGRHFMPKEFVKKYIDLLALHKLNTFHWHLTEDQGWRIEIKKYPRLTEVGAWRAETLVGRPAKDPAENRYDGVRHGGFYTQDDVREIVAYARDRFITVVPEIEMPGHAVAAIAAYPELGVDAAGTTVLTSWGVTDNILSPTDTSVRFMQDVLTEVLALFPGQFIHIGGDEAAKGRWKASPAVPGADQGAGAEGRGRDAELVHPPDGHLPDVEGPPAHRVGRNPRRRPRAGRCSDVVERHEGRHRGGRGRARRRDGADHPHLSRLLPGQGPMGEPLAIGGFLPLETVYLFEPIPADLSPEAARRVLGAQAQLWTEYMPTPKHVEYMAFPRLSALAEVVWTPARRRTSTTSRRASPRTCSGWSHST